MVEATTLQSLIEGWAGHGDRPAIVALRQPEPEIWSYARLAGTACGLAAGLLRAGLAPAEPVALVGPASPEWLACCFGIVAAGGVAVPLDAQLPDEELAGLLLDSRCRRIFATRARADRLGQSDSLAGLRTSLLDESDGAQSWAALLDREPAPLPAVAPEDPALLLYTSGTTGVPKGVPLSHANLLANVTALRQERLVNVDDRVLLPLPLHHGYPLTVGVLGTLASGSGLLLPAGTSGPALAEALREATVLIGVPRLYTALLGAFAGHMSPRQRRLLDLCVRAQRLGLPLGRWLLAPLRHALAPRLRLAASGGAALDETVEQTLLAIGWQVLTGYGLTETAPMLTLNLPGRARAGSAGRPLPGVSLSIADPDETGVGEILARGPNVFHGYWQRPDLTAAAFTADGWFRTRDLGRLDAEGYLHIASRTSERITLPNGETVLPEEIERTYQESGIIEEIAVLEQAGTLVGLIVPNESTLRARGTVQVENQLRDELERLGGRLRPFQRVARITLTREHLPRTPIGKLQRFRLPSLWQQAVAHRQAAQPYEPTEADRELLAEPTAAALWSWLQTRFPEGAHDLDASPQLDLGIDSLAWVGLTIEIEQRFGRSLDEAAVGRIFTLRDLLRETVAAPLATQPAAQPAPAATPAGLPLAGWALHLLGRTLMALLFRLRVEGRENLPAAGPLLLVPNHASYLDPLALAAALPLRRLPGVHWAGWAGLLFASGSMRLVSHACNVFALDPRRGGLAGIAVAEALLRQGRSVVWFPEGRRSPDGRLQPFTPGIGLLIARTGATAIPVRIRGSFQAWPRSRRLPRPHPIGVVFGRPLAGCELVASGAGDESHRKITERLREAVEALE